ncbi:DMT family transporter [Kaarinaea lacus]
MPRNLLASPVIALCLSSLLWSGNFIVGRALRDEVEALTLNYWRWLIALLLLLVLGFSRTRQNFSALRRHWFFMVVLSLTGIVGFHLCVYQALKTTYAINALLFLSISPLLIILGSRLAYKDSINYWQVTGVMLSLAGVIGLLTQGDLQRLGSLQFNVGDIWMLVAVALWSAYSVILKRKPEPLSQSALLNGTAAAGVVIMTPLYLMTMTDGIGMALTLPNISGLLYVSVFSSVVAYYCWNYGVNKLGPNTAGSFLHLMPLFGAILSVVLLGEEIRSYHLVGAGFIAAGIALSRRAGAGSIGL